MWEWTTISSNEDVAFGGEMRHIILFLTTVFVILFLAVLNRDNEISSAAKPTVRIFGYSSFAGHWGPGPKLKEIFEKSCQCQVEFIVAADNSMLLQKLKLEGASLGADLVVGLDQFDLQKALSEQSWQKLNFSNLDLEPEIKGRIQNDYFVPYDWGVLSFMMKKTNSPRPMSLDDLLDDALKGQIGLQDPRTSSPGFQFLWWVLRSKGEEDGFRFLAKLMNHAHSWSSSWSTSIGLYNRDQVKTVFTYVTSPVYYAVEEKNMDHESLSFREPLPLQIEFTGIPTSCRQCDLAEQFLNLMLSSEGQRLLMEKNYMFPVLRGAKEGTPFAALSHVGRTMSFEIPSDAEVDRLLKKWSELRRGEPFQ